MRVVIVDGDVSYPPTSGKRLRTLHLMLRLAQRHQITYLGRFSAPGSSAKEATEYLRDHKIEPILIDHPIPGKAGLTFYARLAANLFSSSPYNVASHRSVPMSRAVQKLVADQAVDVWQFEWAPYMETLPDPARKLVMAHNVDTLIWQRYYQTARNPLKRFYLKLQWRKMRRFEQQAFRAASHVVAVSEEDALLIREHFAMPRVDVVENGIDRPYFEQVQGQRRQNRILFLGALDWRPNLDAVDLLLERIFPAVRAQLPEACLDVVGRKPPPSLVERVKQCQGVRLLADVADVRPFLAESSVMAVPLRIGGGSRLKILESLAANLAVVSTAVGAEGLSLEPGRHYIRAEEDQMAAALVQVLNHPEQAQAMAENGRQMVLARYDWDVLARKLEQVWEKMMKETPPNKPAV